ncbi:MAG: phosphatidylglycerophosphatase A [Deltaproteobacteria bacterium HGW-Deltaproteobacteria-9]|nr:MAG: phosphatidylglycerophosphatase A [Deltaproteobacteria bacterium HGW-Deltaproteobacteria-9]
MEKRHYFLFCKIEGQVLNQKIIKFLACGFGSGLLPVAPGTFGTLVGVPICLLCLPLPWFLRLLVVMVLMVLSVYIAGRAEEIYAKKDDQRIVIDEIIGFQVAMLPVAITGVHLGVAFVLFRIFDILKPFPLNSLQKLPGGWGVVMDDVGAGVYAGLILFLLTWAGVL